MDSHKQSVVSTLTDMGYESSLIEKAYARCEIKTVEGLVNFFETHPNLAQETDVPEERPAEGHQSQGEPISAHVNQGMAAELIKEGHTKDVAEKALFMTQNVSVQAAKNWMEEHKTDPDYHEPLFIVRQDPSKPKLTPEEAKKKAKELQARIREEQAKKDKQAEFESEVARLKSGKNMTQAQRELEELQTKLEMQKLQRDREETEAAKRKVMEEIEKDRRNKGLKSTSKIIKPLSETYPDILKKMHKVYPDNTIIKTCLKTIGLYLSKLWKANDRQLHPES